MDPNNNLRDLRANVHAALGIVYSIDKPKKKVLLDLLREIAEDFDNLDVHLGHGGPLPSDWPGRAVLYEAYEPNKWPWPTEDQ